MPSKKRNRDRDRDRDRDRRGGGGQKETGGNMEPLGAVRKFGNHTRTDDRPSSSRDRDSPPRKCRPPLHMPPPPWPRAAGGKKFPSLRRGGIKTI